MSHVIQLNLPKLEAILPQLIKPDKGNPELRKRLWSKINVQVNSLKFRMPMCQNMIQIRVGGIWGINFLNCNLET